jgi:hypothetical protein
VTEGAPALLGLVAEEEVGQDEAGCSGGQGEGRDHPERDGNSDHHQRSADEVGDEQSGDRAEELVEGVAFRGSPDQFELLAVAVRVVAERLDEPPGARADQVRARRTGGRGFVDCGAGAAEAGEDRIEAWWPWCEGAPGDQDPDTDAGSEDEHDERVHVATSVWAGSPERAVNRSGSSISAMRVSSQPPRAKIPPTMASMI